MRKPAKAKAAAHLRRQENLLDYVNQKEIHGGHRFYYIMAEVCALWLGLCFKI
jgi:hypothetical protein